MRASTALLAAAAPLASAISLTTTSEDSIKDAASSAAWGTLTFYTGNDTGEIPGELPSPYYWWECGAMFGSLINYWYYTGDDTYNSLVKEGMLFQVGDDDDYMPANQTEDEGNDDQVFWGFAAMQAAEYNFPNPAADKPQWLALAQGVFNSQADRWNNATCNGGLRWQIFAFNDGYSYKNAPSNAGFANLGSRLYKYTGNETYKDWVEASWGWMTGVGMINTTTGAVYDGTSVGNNCTTLNHDLWSYSHGMVIHMCANMWNATGDDTWKDRMLLVWNKTESYFFDADTKIMTETLCEASGDCDTDALSFKAYLSRFLAASAKIAPFFWDTVEPYLLASATAAAEQCDGTGSDGNVDACGFDWTDGTTWDGTTGLGQQMDALEVIQSLLTPYAAYPVTNTTGGTSTGDSSAGSSGDTSSDPALPTTPITTGQRAGAGVLTGGIIVGLLGGTWWLVL